MSLVTARTVAVSPWRARLRRFHRWVAAAFTLNFLLLAGTGFLVQHREWFRLEDKSVRRRWLPTGYRPSDPDSEIRADIVVADLHSGRLFGRYGPVVVDAAAAAWLLMMGSGAAMQIICNLRGKSGPSSS